MKILYETFELDFDKITAKDIACAVNIFAGFEPVEFFKGTKIADTDFVSWNYYGNYIMYYDGNGAVYYFCKKHLKISGGYQLQVQEEIEKCKNYLKQFAI